MEKTDAEDASGAAPESRLGAEVGMSVEAADNTVADTAEGRSLDSLDALVLSAYFDDIMNASSPESDPARSPMHAADKTVADTAEGRSLDSLDALVLSAYYDDIMDASSPESGPTRSPMHAADNTVADTAEGLDSLDALVLSAYYDDIMDASSPESDPTRSPMPAASQEVEEAESEDDDSSEEETDCEDSAASDSDVVYELSPDYAALAPDGTRISQEEFLQQMRRECPVIQGIDLTKEGKPIKITCAICLAEIDAEEESRTLHCQHTFHASCVDQWFATFPRTYCPTCRTWASNEYKEANIKQ